MAATEQPKVVVKIPEVRLRLDDVTYLRSLTAPNGVQCHVPIEKIQRLRLLGLIEEKEVTRTEQELSKLQAELDRLIVEMKAALDRGEFHNIDRYALQGIKNKMQPYKKDVLTEAGLALLKTGTVTVKMAKRGCL